MGRKRKFGEESDFVSVRVPKSKRKEYRDAIKGFVDDKFAHESNAMNKDVETKDDNNKLDDFRKFEEFIKDINNGDKEKEDII